MSAPRTPSDPFERVAEIVARETGTDVHSISRETDLSRDLNFTRSDARHLFEALGKAYPVDWKDFDATAQFGDKRCGLPPPWQMAESRLLYRTPPCRVDDLVRAVETGRWAPRSLEARPAWQRALLWSASLAQLIMIAMPLGAIVWALFLR